MKPVTYADITNTPDQVSEQALDAFICDNYKTMHDLVETYVQTLTERGQCDPSDKLFDPLFSSLEDLMDELGIRQKIRTVMRDLMGKAELKILAASQSRLFN